ncbi:UNVERIFIED_CONTAM: hypothetical protein PYX00_004769 [Menopon gallinae]|uniref:Uncharacterized protein n=1 Tax=Menopon gallinae TaxID=328185 RepID=A0AAW2I795_9NEOP
MNGRTLVILASLACFGSAEDHSFETCLKKDSISCLQIHVYKKLRAILSQDRIDLLGGFRIVRENGTEEETAVAGDVLESREVAERQALLEDFIYRKVVHFFKHRSLQWNAVAAFEQIAPTARQLINNIPKNVKEKMAASFFSEGRGKKKFKWFFPVIIAVKTTFFTWVKVVFVGVAFLAKKALVMSIIALTIAIFLAFKKHGMKEYVHPHYEIHGEA